MVLFLQDVRVCFQGIPTIYSTPSESRDCTTYAFWSLLLMKLFSNHKVFFPCSIIKCLGHEAFCFLIYEKCIDIGKYQKYLDLVFPKMYFQHVFLHLLNCFCIFYLLNNIYLCESQLLGYPTKGCSSQSWSRPDAGTTGFIKFSNTHGRSPTLQPSSSIFPQLLIHGYIRSGMLVLQVVAFPLYYNSNYIFSVSFYVSINYQQTMLKTKPTVNRGNFLADPVQLKALL